MYKGDRRKEVCRLFGRQKHMHVARSSPQLPPSFECTFTSPPKNEKPLAAKKLPPYCITAEKITPYFGLPLAPKSLPPKNEKPPTAKKKSAVLHYRRKNTAIFWFTASDKVVTTKNDKTANRLEITAVWQYRPACVRLKNRYRRPPCFLWSASLSVCCRESFSQTPYNYQVIFWKQKTVVRLTFEPPNSEAYNLHLVLVRIFSPNSP